MRARLARVRAFLHPVEAAQFLEALAPRPLAAAAEQQRGAGRRVDLVAVMHLEDLDVPVGPERGAACSTSSRSRLTPSDVLARGSRRRCFAASSIIA